jgi:multidrug efflux system membrane fusion protein
MPDTAVAAGHISKRRLRTAGFVVAGAAAVVVVVGIVGRVSADQSLKGWTHQQAIPTVHLVTTAAGGEKTLSLPGDVQAFYSAPIHARVSGYLKKWYADIGAPVKAGQVLAEIDTPDLDQQVLQARADLATAEANQKLSATTAKRWTSLLAQDAVSKQEADEKAGDLAAKSSLVNAARANLNRLLAQESFKRITAPFDGVVTVRNTDIGQLISIGGAADTALFTVSDQRQLRVYVHVPQNQSALIRPGLAASLTVPEYPGQTFKAVVSKDARALDPQSGALLVELQLDNADGRLKPGEYAQVSFGLASGAATARVPATAIQFRNDGPTVAIVGRDSHVQVRAVTITRDLGSSVELGSGVQPGDRIIDNPPEALGPGDLVRVAGSSIGKGAADARS